MKNLYILPEEERLLDEKRQKVEYVFSKLDDRKKIECLIKSDYMNTVDDLIEFYLTKLGNELSIDEYYHTYKNVKRAWNELSEEEQLDLIIKIICNDDLTEYMEDNIDFFTEYFADEIQKIHWIRVMPFSYYPREDVIAMVKEMLEDPGNEKLVKELKIDKTIDLTKASDEELGFLHYALLGIIY